MHKKNPTLHNFEYKCYWLTHIPENFVKRGWHNSGSNMVNYDANNMTADTRNYKKGTDIGSKITEHTLIDKEE